MADTGSPVDPRVAPLLLKAPVRSNNGLGIGLFQAARQARRLGYRLTLGKQPDGVRFELVDAPG